MLLRGQQTPNTIRSDGYIFLTSWPKTPQDKRFAYRNGVFRGVWVSEHTACRPRRPSIIRRNIIRYLNQLHIGITSMHHIQFMLLLLLSISLFANASMAPVCEQSGYRIFIYTGQGGHRWLAASQNRCGSTSVRCDSPSPS